MISRDKIRKGYDRIQPTQEQKERMKQNILTAASARTPAGKDVPMKRYTKRPLLVAAIAAVMLLLVGCSAAVLMNLDDLRFGEEPYVKKARYQEDGSKVPATETRMSYISVVGAEGSKNQQAMQEWLDFKKAYDPEGTLRSASEDFVAPPEYVDYGAYTQEMVDKIDEICEKYDLKLAGDYAIIQQHDADLLTEALGIDGILKNKAKAEAEFGGCSFTQCGNFSTVYNVTLTDPEAQQEYMFVLDYYYYDKAYFDTGYIVIEDTENARQWNYTLADGTKVLIVSEAGDGTHILYDREDAFIRISFNNVGWNWDYPSDVMSKRDMELVAEALDYSLKPKKVENMAEVQARLEERYQESLKGPDAETQARIQKEYEENECKDSYADLIGRMRDNEEYFTSRCNIAFEDFWETMEYTLMDVTGDGEDELILGKDGFVKEIWTMEDGKTDKVTGSHAEGYLCEGNVFEHYVFLDGKPYHFYYRLGEDGLARKLMTVEYDTYNETWILDESEDGSVYEAISEERAMEIIDSFVRIQLEMKPVSEFPMN